MLASSKERSPRGSERQLLPERLWWSSGPVWFHLLGEYCSLPPSCPALTLSTTLSFYLKIESCTSEQRLHEQEKSNKREKASQGHCLPPQEDSNSSAKKACYMYTVRHQIVSQVLSYVFWEFNSCYAVSLLPRQTRGTLRKLFTKPANNLMTDSVHDVLPQILFH